MLAEGKAYRCYATAEELNEMREAQRAAGKPIRYDGRWRDRTAGPEEDGKPFVIRLRAPQTGETIVHDVIQGDVTFANENLDDMILLRSDGTPTYMLAVVVDDQDMGVTHVVECGPGKVLAGMTKRIAPELQSAALADRASLEEALKC